LEAEPVQLTTSTIIRAPVERVFAVVTDIARWPEVVGGIDSVEMLTEGPVAVGTRFRETRKIHGRVATEEMTVAEIKAPDLFVLTAENHGTRYRAEHYFEAVDEGTRLSMTFAGRPVTWLARLMMPIGLLMSGSVKRLLEADFADIKRAAEERASL
jgi:uncharacterized protein YndB with AHSA1/START domain